MIIVISFQNINILLSYLYYYYIIITLLLLMPVIK